MRNWPRRGAWPSRRALLPNPRSSGKNRSSPALRFIPRIIEFLGYTPDDTKPQSPGQKIAAFRRLRGLTQKELARRLGVDPSTVASWERSEHRPSRHLASIIGRVTAPPPRPTASEFKAFFEQ